MMRIGLAADHEGFPLKEILAIALTKAEYDVVDFGARTLAPGDDYPDYCIPLAEAVAAGSVERGIAVCGSGIGVLVAANKVRGVRAGLCHDPFSARQGVEDDNINVLCLGSQIVGPGLAWELTKIFLAARFSGAERHRRRLAKVAAAELHQQQSVEVEST